MRSRHEALPTRPIVCLNASAGDADPFPAQRRMLRAHVWQTPQAVALDRTNPRSVDAWVEAAATELTVVAGGAGAHVIATGPAAYGAIVLARTHPQLVMSLSLGDPDTDPDEPHYRELLAGVRAPTLVLASAPDRGLGQGQAITIAQSVAGGIADGVFVVLDGAPVPAHRERGTSFNDWVTAFIAIAEGLSALEHDRQEELRG